MENTQDLEKRVTILLEMSESIRLQEELVKLLLETQMRVLAEMYRELDVAYTKSVEHCDGPCFNSYNLGAGDGIGDARAKVMWHLHRKEVEHFEFLGKPKDYNRIKIG